MNLVRTIVRNRVSVKKPNKMTNIVDPDETALYEPSHHDIHCLQKKPRKNIVLVCRAETVKTDTLYRLSTEKVLAKDLLTV